jgi:SpoVK/Ycf46/Vps4 family AAA+-type ATPase
MMAGATNRPQELDEAARRRLTKRLYIPLPSSEARAWIIRNLLEKDGLFKLTEEETNIVCKLTEGTHNHPGFFLLLLILRYHAIFLDISASLVICRLLRI